MRYQGTEREAILAQLRQRLGLSAPKHPTTDASGKVRPLPGPQANPKVSWHGAKMEVISPSTTKATTTMKAAQPPPPPPPHPPVS